MLRSIICEKCSYQKNMNVGNFKIFKDIVEEGKIYSLDGQAILAS